MGVTINVNKQHVLHRFVQEVETGGKYQSCCPTCMTMRHCTHCQFIYTLLCRSLCWNHHTSHAHGAKRDSLEMTVELLTRALTSDIKCTVITVQQSSYNNRASGTTVDAIFASCHWFQNIH